MVSKFAQVKNGKTQNLALFETREDAIRITRAIYGPESDAVNIDDLDVRFGAMYRGGTFYNVNEDGTETEAEKLPTLNTVIAQNDEIALALAELIGG